MRRLTFAPEVDAAPVWLPNQRHIVFTSEREGIRNMFLRSVDGTGAVEKLTNGPNDALWLPLIHPGASLLIFLARGRQYPVMIWVFLRSLISAFKTRRCLALENLALRQQLAVVQRSVKRPLLSNLDRGFWVLLHRVWTDWDSFLVIVKSETVVRWYRAGFRRYWTWKSRKRRPGRPRVSREVRELIRDMSRASVT